MEPLIWLLAIDLIVFGPLCAWLAQQKGRAGIEGFIVGAVFGVLGILVMGMAPAPVAAQQTCPKCAEKVLASASVCRYCGAPLTPTVVGPVEAPTLHFSKPFIIIALILLAGIAWFVWGIIQTNQILSGLP